MGIYRGGTDILKFVTAGIDAVTIDASQTVILSKAVYRDQTSENFFRLKFQDTGGTANDVGIGQPASGQMGFNITAGGNYIFYNGSAGEMVRFDGSGNVGIGTSSPDGKLHLFASDASITPDADADDFIIESNSATGITIGSSASSTGSIRFADSGSPRAGMLYYSHITDEMRLYTAATERMRIESGGNVLVGKTDVNTSIAGVYFSTTGSGFTRESGTVAIFNRQNNDGTVIGIVQQDITEGTISVSGSTVSYNGGHLSRWSRLSSGNKDTSIVKGTVMSNLDEMVEWLHEEVLWTDEDELPDGVSVGDVKTSAYTEDNEQLNKMAVSSVEGDANVAGVFVNWDNDDDWNDMNIAMTGDMVIRVAQGTTVARGDLLMSAGDGTAKPQGDDIVRSKTIAKVTSTNVSHTYDDGTYLVPCVLMAC